MSYTTCTVPAGGKISIQSGRLVVPDRPIIPFIRGDGTGPDIWAASVRVLDAAVGYFGNKDDAWNWLQSPVRGLGNVAPVDLIATETGALEVTDLIGRLEHGVFA